MTDKKAMKLALDALETEVSIDWTNNDEFNASAEKMHEAIAALKERLAQPADTTGQAPCARHCEATAFQIVIKNLRGDIERMKAAQPAQRTEQNFCPRCGKRTKDIHTCTPPKEKNDV